MHVDRHFDYLSWADGSSAIKLSTNHKGTGRKFIAVRMRTRVLFEFGLWCFLSFGNWQIIITQLQLDIDKRKSSKADTLRRSIVGFESVHLIFSWTVSFLTRHKCGVITVLCANGPVGKKIASWGVFAHCLKLLIGICSDSAQIPLDW